MQEGSSGHVTTLQRSLQLIVVVLQLALSSTDHSGALPSSISSMVDSVMECPALKEWFSQQLESVQCIDQPFSSTVCVGVCDILMELFKACPALVKRPSCSFYTGLLLQSVTRNDLSGRSFGVWLVGWVY